MGAFLRPIKNHWFGFQNTPVNAKDICEVGGGRLQTKSKKMLLINILSIKLPNQFLATKFIFYFSAQRHQVPRMGEGATGSTEGSKLGYRQLKHKTILSLIFGHKLMGAGD